MRELEAAVGVRPAGRLRGAGVVQVRQLQAAGHGDELAGLEVQQGHGAQRRAGQEVKELDQIQTHLGAGRAHVPAERKKHRLTIEFPF